MAHENKILIYTTVDGQHKLEVNLQDDTVWLSLDQIADLFQRNKSTISRHIKNIFEEEELKLDSVVAKFATTKSEKLRVKSCEKHSICSSLLLILNF